MAEQDTTVAAVAEQPPVLVELPVLPLRDTVLFPNSFMPLAVARESSIALIDAAIAGNKQIGVFTQRTATDEDPGQDGLFPMGTLAHIHKMFKLPDGSLRLIVQGMSRIGMDRVTQATPFLRARVHEVLDVVSDPDSVETDALVRNIRANLQQIVQLSPVLSDDLASVVANITDPGRLTDFVASSLSTVSTNVKQDLLETVDVRSRMETLNRVLTKELEVLEVGSKIQSQVESEVGRNQREYFLREQMKAIQRELGEGDEQAREVDDLAAKIDAAGMPEDVRKEARRELDRLAKMPPAAAEYTVARTYIDWLVAVPWTAHSDDVIELAHTKVTLDEDHSGIEKVKGRARRCFMPRE